FIHKTNFSVEAFSDAQRRKFVQYRNILVEMADTGWRWFNENLESHFESTLQTTLSGIGADRLEVAKKCLRLAENENPTFFCYGTEGVHEKEGFLKNWRMIEKLVGHF